LTRILSPRITVIGMSPAKAEDTGRGLKTRGPHRHCPGPCVVPPPWGQELALGREARKLHPERKLGWQEFMKRWPSSLHSHSTPPASARNCQSITRMFPTPAIFLDQNASPGTRPPLVAGLINTLRKNVSTGTAPRPGIDLLSPCVSIARCRLVSSPTIAPLAIFSRDLPTRNPLGPSGMALALRADKA